MSSKSTVWVSKETKKKLRDYGEMGDSFEDVILKILEEVNDDGA